MDVNKFGDDKLLFCLEKMVWRQTLKETVYRNAQIPDDRNMWEEYLERCYLVVSWNKQPQMKTVYEVK